MTSNECHGRQTIHQIRFMDVKPFTKQGSFASMNQIRSPFFLIGQVILYKSMSFLIFDHISLMTPVGDFFLSNFSNFYDFLPSHNTQMAMIKEMFKSDVKKITREEPMETPLGDGFTIYSGGALGSDSVAEFAARELGMNVEIKIPPGHPRARSVSPLTPQELDEANPYVERAAQMLHRSLYQHPTNTFKTNLLKRNFHIVREAEAVYAFGRFQSTTDLQMLKGGTGWTVQLAIELCKETGRAPMIFVYDTYHQSWFECVRQFDTDTFVFQRLYKKPYLMSQSAVVGSREIEDTTGKEIFALFERTADRVMHHRKSMQLLRKQMEACHISPLASHPNQSEANKLPSWASK